MGRAVRFNIGCVDRCRGLDPAGLDKGLQNALPDAPARPAIEAIVDGGAGTVDRRAIAPPAPTLQNMQDAADHTPIVDAPGARLIGR